MRRPYGSGCLPENHNGRKKMHELRLSECQLVGGGNGGQGGSAQTCTAIPGGGAQCTSNNGRSMVIQTYDRGGNLTNTTVCTENRSASLSVKVTTHANGEAKGGGGTSCRSSSSSTQNSNNPGQLLIYSPFFYGAP